MSKLLEGQRLLTEPILIVSTHTRDRLPDMGGRGTRVIPGGPAYYMALALDRLGAPHRVLTNGSVDVDVIHTPQGEAYIIPPVDPIPLPPRLRASAVILSPVIGEVDPEKIPSIDGLLVVDVQGFVRQPGVRTDRARGPFDLASLLSRAHLVKASEEEIDLLSAESRDALCSTTALITGGKRGARIVSSERVTTIAANPVDTPNTIGAGDTFLAVMTWSVVQGRTFETAAAEAARFTEDTLRGRRGAILQE